tara:strand:- start:592 stop:1194 length:603 start_codon:yes stop_codon:yes gene_type:complete
MNKKASVMVEVMVFLVIAVFLSATILLLVKSGVIKTKNSYKETSVLNTEFLPLGKSGDFAITDFSFCGSVDNDFNCISKKNNFELGDEVYFRFTVESGTSNGEVMVVENYRLKGPQGNVLLDVEEKNNFNFNIVSRNEHESINFKDFFIVGLDESEGTYTLELFLENPLINKQANLAQNFVIEQPYHLTEKYIQGFGNED